MRGGRRHAGALTPNAAMLPQSFATAPCLLEIRCSPAAAEAKIFAISRLPACAGNNANMNAHDREILRVRHQRQPVGECNGGIAARPRRWPRYVMAFVAEPPATCTNGSGHVEISLRCWPRSGSHAGPVRRRHAWARRRQRGAKVHTQRPRPANTGERRAPAASLGGLAGFSCGGALSRLRHGRGHAGDAGALHASYFCRRQRCAATPHIAHGWTLPAMRRLRRHAAGQVAAAACTLRGSTMKRNAGQAGRSAGGMRFMLIAACLRKYTVGAAYANGLEVYRGASRCRAPARLSLSFSKQISEVSNRIDAIWLRMRCRQLVL